jgi:hypothetical protein
VTLIQTDAAAREAQIVGPARWRRVIAGGLS